MSLRGVGIDVADVRRFVRLDERSGAAFRRRWFTQGELAQSDAAADPVTSLAARFAGKEATWKAIGLGLHAPPLWRSIAILDIDCHGRCRVELSGEVAAAAAQAGVGAVNVTIGISGHLAMAMAMAELSD